MVALPPLNPPVDEIERRLKWRLLPTLSFIAVLVALLAVAITSLALRPRHPRGLPEDADARTAVATLAGRVSGGTGELRWRAAVLGGEPGRAPANPAMHALAALVAPALEAARRRHPGDPRALAALAALDVVNHDYARAAHRYRHACELAPRYAEGRLGAGVALALEAARTPGPWQARALRLQAIAQFAMVDSTEDEYGAALFDRARVLADAGRAAEAGFYARRYLAAAARDPFADELRPLAAGR